MPKQDKKLRHFRKDMLGLFLLKKKIIKGIAYARGSVRLLKLFGFRQLQKQLPIPPAGIDV